MPIILIGGGSRSGKSTYALTRARDFEKRLGFVATAEAHDEEMRERIARHQADRPNEFVTVEEPLKLAATLAGCEAIFDTVVVDCLTLWVSNLIFAGYNDLDGQFAELVRISGAFPGTLLFVTNEVGCGLVPETEVGRRFRDAAGRLNQMLATAASEVVWMVFGVPLRIR
jgi:adenosylcobinamide kinase/adenosylcobinamide-phosphate guanylyltransferase